MPFFIFLLTNATLFVRPADFVPALETTPIYFYLLLTCLALSFTTILSYLTEAPLSRKPITVCVLGLLAAVALSHVSNGDFYMARVETIAFAKTVAYFLLLVSLIDRPSRLRAFLLCVVFLTAVVAVTAVLSLHGIVSLPSLEALQRRDIENAEGDDEDFILQLRGPGVFNDPNDLCLVLIIGMSLSVYFLVGGRLRLLRPVFVAALGLFGYALLLTRSRGGFLGLLATVVTVSVSRLGGKRSALALALLIPALFVVFAGRSTRISTGEGTFVSRVQLWSEGLSLFVTRPVFGIGTRNYDEEVGHVAHNSFVHSLTELGLFGGTFFLGMFYCAVVGLRRLGKRPERTTDPEVRRLRPYLLGATAGYLVGIFSLSRCYIDMTYMVAGLAAVYQGPRLSLPDPSTDLRFDGRLVRNLLVVDAAVLAVTKIFIYLFAGFG
jgi:hypothetical protein